MPAELVGELKVVLEGAAFAPITYRAFLRITGPDAPRWLNGMVTNNIAGLGPGEGSYNFLLNAQGRIQGDATIYREPFAEEPAYVLETDKSQIENLQLLLDKFIIMDDVELTPVSPIPGLLLLGPQAPDLLAQLIPSSPLAALAPLRLAVDEPFQITTPAAGPVPQLFLTSTSETELERLIEKLRQTKTLEVFSPTLEALRILEARPRYGTDIRNTDTAKDLPQETNQTHALHFAKGCYLGQEIVERIRSRGQVHRLFTPFRLEGTPPSTFPTPLQANGKPAGEITSAAPIPTIEGPVWLALGYARREALDSHTPFTYPGGTAHPRQAGQLK